MKKKGKGKAIKDIIKVNNEIMEGLGQIIDSKKLEEQNDFFGVVKEHLLNLNKVFYKV